MSAPVALLVVVFIVGGLIRMPIGFTMISGGIVYLLAAGRDMGLAGEQILNSLFQSFVLLAVPLFIFAANVMDAGTISQRLLTFALALVGRMRGGLAHVNVIASLIFSGMSGSAIADAAGIGRVIINMMVQNGRYSPGFAAAITAASATIGPIIPPSIPMVLYALVSDTSVGFLFLGGIVPGLIMAALLMIAVSLIARARAFPVEDPIPRRELPRIVARAAPPLLMPVILLGGIYGGVATPTEAAAIAAGYALVLAVVGYRALGLGDIVRLLVDSARASAVVAMIIAGAFVFNFIVAIEGMPNALAGWLSSVELSPLVFLLLVNALFLVLGAFLDTITLLLILVPMLVPSVRALGLDTVHFGVVIVVNMMIGLVTPPYGVLLFVINGLTGIPLRDIVREIWPFIAILVAALLAIVLLPDLVLWVPRLLGYAG